MFSWALHSLVFIRGRELKLFLNIFCFAFFFNKQVPSKPRNLIQNHEAVARRVERLMHEKLQELSQCKFTIHISTDMNFHQVNQTWPRGPVHTLAGWVLMCLCMYVCTQHISENTSAMCLGSESVSKSGLLRFHNQLVEEN